MNAVEVLGVGAVIVMVLSYALENRHRHFVLVFAVGCVGAAVYAYLIGSYPFMAAEAVWAAIAFVRWSRIRNAMHR